MFEDFVAAIEALPVEESLEQMIIEIFTKSLTSVMAMWNAVVFNLDLQVSALEDQLEHDFWDKPQNTVSILHQTQRISRRLTTYCEQVIMAEKDLTIISAGKVCEHLDIDIKDVKERLNILIQRTDKAIPALLASIAIREGAKASSLTAVALWFAPLSLSVSIVSIDGNTRFGGRKYWIMGCIAVPLLFLMIAVANTSDRFMSWLGRFRRGRAFVSFIKSENHMRHGAR